MGTVTVTTGTAAGGGLTNVYSLSGRLACGSHGLISPLSTRGE